MAQVGRPTSGPGREAVHAGDRGRRAHRGTAGPSTDGSGRERRRVRPGPAAAGRGRRPRGLPHAGRADPCDHLHRGARPGERRSAHHLRVPPGHPDPRSRPLRVHRGPRALAQAPAPRRSSEREGRRADGRGHAAAVPVRVPDVPQGRPHRVGPGHRRGGPRRGRHPAVLAGLPARHHPSAPGRGRPPRRPRARARARRRAPGDGRAQEHLAPHPVARPQGSDHGGAGLGLDAPPSGPHRGRDRRAPRRDGVPRPADGPPAHGPAGPRAGGPRNRRAHTLSRRCRPACSGHRAGVRRDPRPRGPHRDELGRRARRCAQGRADGGEPAGQRGPPYAPIEPAVGARRALGRRCRDRRRGRRPGRARASAPGDLRAVPEGDARGGDPGIGDRAVPRGPVRRVARRTSLGAGPRGGRRLVPDLPARPQRLIDRSRRIPPLVPVPGPREDTRAVERSARAALVPILSFLLLASVLAPPAGAAASVSLDAATGVIVAGGAVRLSGALTDDAACLRGRDVTLSWHPAGDPTTTIVDTTTTASDGTFSFSDRPSSTGRYSADVAPTGSCGSASSPDAAVRVRALVELSLVRGALVAGSCAKVEASVTPAKPSQTVELQRRAGGSWTTIDTLTLDDASQATARPCFDWSDIGVVRLRARWPAQDALNETNASPALELPISEAPWMEQIDDLVGGRAMSVSVGDRGAAMYEHAPRHGRTPASNEKLLLSMTLLDTFGTGHEIVTDGAAKRAPDQGVLRGDLWIRGRGDPELDRSTIAALARRLHADGVQRIRGRVIGPTGSSGSGSACRARRAPARRRAASRGSPASDPALSTRSCGRCSGLPTTSTPRSWARGSARRSRARPGRSRRGPRRSPDGWPITARARSAPTTARGCPTGIG